MEYIYTILKDDKKYSKILLALGVILSYYIVKRFINYLCTRSTRKKLAIQGKKCRDARDKKIQEFFSLTENKVEEEKQNFILSLSATELIESFKSQKIKVEDALITYAWRAGTIGKGYGLICDVDFFNALKTAQEYDKKIANREELGPLFGLPISVKDNYQVADMRITSGFESLSNTVQVQDSLFVSILRSKGAIPFVISNMPTGGMAIESSNQLWGIARNPWNFRKVVGGSSGGEGGLVGGRCSPLGLGNDIGGSIRIPSAFCGCYSLKPTSVRVSAKGLVTWTGDGHSGMYNVRVSCGPIARSVDDVVLFSRSIFGEFHEDDEVYKIPFNEEMYQSTKKLKIGYIVETSECEIAPDIKDAMTDVVKKLENEGHELVEFKINDHLEFFQLGLSIMINTNIVESIINTSKGEALPFYYNDLYQAFFIPKWVKWIASKAYSLVGEKRYGKLLANIKIMKDKNEYVESLQLYSRLHQRFFDYWKTNNFDALICPVFPSPAFDIGKSADLLLFNTYAPIFNYPDMPAGTIPITLSTGKEYVTKDRDSYAKVLTTTVNTGKDLPIVIQVGALPNKDELVLRLMKEIDHFYRYDLNVAQEVMQKIEF